MKKAFVACCMCLVVSYIFGQTSNLNSSYDCIKLPDKSFIYPDTFAVYWKPTSVEKEAGVTSIKIKYATLFDDVIEETDFMKDSIISFIFHHEFSSSRAFILQWQTDSKIRKRVRYENLKRLILLSKDEEIEALRALVSNAFRWQNVKLLADAYEKKQCYVNAYYIYMQLMYLDPQGGKQLLADFLLRNELRLSSNPMREFER